MTQKRTYLAATEGKSWTLQSGLSYTLRSPDFWFRTVGFSVFPVLIPKLVGVINYLYVSREALGSFPPSILAILTVDLPFVLFHAAAWLFVTRKWSRERMHP